MDRAWEGPVTMEGESSGGDKTVVTLYSGLVGHGHCCSST